MWKNFFSLVCAYIKSLILLLGPQTLKYLHLALYRKCLPTPDLRHFIISLAEWFSNCGSRSIICW